MLYVDGENDTLQCNHIQLFQVILNVTYAPRVTAIYNRHKTDAARKALLRGVGAPTPR